MLIGRFRTFHFFRSVLNLRTPGQAHTFHGFLSRTIFLNYVNFIHVIYFIIFSCLTNFFSLSRCCLFHQHEIKLRKKSLISFRIKSEGELAPASYRKIGKINNQLRIPKRQKWKWANRRLMIIVESKNMWVSHYKTNNIFSIRTNRHDDLLEFLSHFTRNLIKETNFSSDIAKLMMPKNLFFRSISMGMSATKWHTQNINKTFHFS